MRPRHIGHADASPDLESPVELKSDLAVCTFVVFLLLLLVLWKFAWGPISLALEKREKALADYIASTKQAHDDAKQLLAEHERKMAGTAQEVRELLEAARRDGERVKAEILVEAKSAADAERARAVRDIESATDQALNTLAERSANLAVGLAGKIVQSKLTPEENARLIQDAINQFPKTEPSKN